MIDNVAVHYAEHGSGPALVALHGAGVDHREIEAAAEDFLPHQGLRRIYPDLPGMGRTRAGDRLAGNDDVVRLLGEFVDRLVGGPALVLGHSYGAYLARGLAARRPESVLGLALLCPIGEHTGALPEQIALRIDPDAYDDLGPEQRSGFDDYFVIRTAGTARRYRDQVLPGIALVDEAAVGRILGNWRIDLGTGTFDKPALILAGRRDSTAGYETAVELRDKYPRATLAVLDNAGHALPHEQPELVRALVADWIDRAQPG
ncbi:alpha/beta fold hydrolase [Microlunatus sp. Gsoil 973]|uniref:alpha/beta fold hydrolase n=1 Tax=Microlunatus sp. Gsoil 973 TaxID=2672569 RepID=UPI0012B46C97|nr:alpha/beta hydrolase [Microlunatus sp. Gsoil 973]QGN33767.1 alpha/beta fold hydrolase [Microlunatus sp. Gsoil 973]